MKYSIPRVVIAGLKGGSGKTTLSLGLLTIFKNDGKRIVPFKKGPDYIDPGWLARASGQPCYNLDSFLFSDSTILNSFLYYSSHYDGALIEGNRGIFDGMDEKGTFSTARLAKRLSAPVIIVIDCAKATTTIAALIQGVLGFDKDLKIGGVVLNQLAGERHETIIRKALETHTDAKVIGAFRRLKGEFLEERHLGLVPHQESDRVTPVLDRIANVVRSSVNIKDVIDIMGLLPALQVEQEATMPATCHSVGDDLRIGVLKDAAFQFYYPENLDCLRNAGATIIEINALVDTRLPDIDALYIGGGFPETQAEDLSKNGSLMKSIKANADEGLPIYAECGGLMFLGEEISYKGNSYGMAGVLPIKCIMEAKPAAHGYTIVEVVEDNPFFRQGTVLKGHEFHYSRVAGNTSGLKMAFSMKRGTGIEQKRDGIVYKNVFATYTHLHALGSPEWADGLIKVARDSKRARRHRA